jgi:MFS family permease
LPVADELPGPEPEFLTQLAIVLRVPAALMLLLVFAGANFVAATMLAWLPDFVKSQHGLDLLQAATVAGLFFPAGNAVGALFGGAVADFVALRMPGGRVLIQASGLLLGAPCVWLAGQTRSLPMLIAALVGIGLCKGVYDANIFASVFDVVPTGVRGTTAGLMNTAGWTAGSSAPMLVGWLSDRFAQGAVIAWTASVYVAAGLLALVAAWLVAHPVKPVPVRA